MLRWWTETSMIIQDVLLASALLVLQWTSHFFEVVIVALV